MNLTIGTIIKKLRTEHSVTQEELAEYLGISFQAVSKWETGNTLPDITLLPKLASFFGVRIDELFSVDHEDELERIDNMLQRETMTDRNYAYAKRILDGILEADPENTDAVKRYAKVYLAKANNDLLTAGRMLEKAMAVSPADEEIFSLYRSVRGGSEYEQHSANDWFIRVCEPYARKHPQNTGLYQMLIEAMISMKYFEKAEKLLDTAKFEGSNRYLKEIFLGDLALAKGNEQAAKDIWESVPDNDWYGQYEAGERFNRLNDYEKAVECFNNAYKAQTAPHKIDMIYSLAFLYKKLGRFNDAKKEWELIVETLLSEYAKPEEDNDIQWARREIKQLDALLKQV
ncbi:MAG: helix-turn-helix domain-containing protein [Lachnospiraceae bacterium]|nr:helix-turn-helix domain-containing protein [Lachnospiraceae bacterium]